MRMFNFLYYKRKKKGHFTKIRPLNRNSNNEKLKTEPKTTIFKLIKTRTETKYLILIQRGR